MDTIYIYGHKHNHNLIKPREEYSYDHILRDPVRSAKAKWAITPFNNNDVLEYKVACREFGRPLEMVHHHWNAIMDVERLWYIVVNIINCSRVCIVMNYQNGNNCVQSIKQVCSHRSRPAYN